MTSKPQLKLPLISPLPRLPYLITKHNTYCSITPNYISHKLLTKFPTHFRSPPSHKCSVTIRNSRILQIGLSTSTWSTFITLTFSTYSLPSSSSDYTTAQKYFRKLIKRVYLLEPDFKYLAVVERGQLNTKRIHYHMLTNLSYNSPYFVHINNPKRKSWLLWKFGFSDVVPIDNTYNGAVFYLMKYLGKNDDLRPPIGKREVFSSRGLNKKERIITYNITSYLQGYRYYDKVSNHYIFVKKQNYDNNI